MRIVENISVEWLLQIIHIQGSIIISLTIYDKILLREKKKQENEEKVRKKQWKNILNPFRE